ncbi:MAG: hypothetical protein WBL27_12265 [Salinimicrobium sp.]
MKNIYLYYFFFLAPGILLALAWRSLPAGIDLFLMFSYIFVYRTILDGMRLNALGVLEKKEIWKMAVPGMRGKYLKQLYFTK